MRAVRNALIAGGAAAAIAELAWRALLAPTYALRPGSAFIGSLGVVAVGGLAGAIWGGTRVLSRSRRLVRTALPIAVLLAGLRGVLPRALAHEDRYETASDSAPKAVAYLRILAAEQEQFRLRRHVYATDLQSLGADARYFTNGSVRLRSNGAAGWSATLTSAEGTCSIWVRDTALRGDPRAVDGSPICQRIEARAPNQGVHTIAAVAKPAVLGFASQTVGGVWAQHRGSPSRRGEVSGDLEASWNTVIGGELLAPAAVAGKQVFVGAHGNGELAALDAETGAVGFRLRVPNWVHHEPAVEAEVVVVGFGNNETSHHGHGARGSDPSGVVALDRRTGFQRWIRFTDGSAMTSPLISGSLAIAAVSSGEVLAWRLTDGAEVWRAELPGASYMGNPLLDDSTVFIGIEPTGLCALAVASGKIRYCKSLSRTGRGAGHASPAALHGIVLQVFNQGVTIRSALHERRFGVALRQVLGLPEPIDPSGRPVVVGELVLVALETGTGIERWRTSFGLGNGEIPGHLAGTPVIVDEAAYLPLPMNQSVAAVQMSTGALAWMARVNPARGSVTVDNGVVLAATRDTSFVVLSAQTGVIHCRVRLPAPSDRAGLTVTGRTGILALRNGLVMARPMSAWRQCRV